MNHSAEITALQSKIDALIEAVAPLVVEYRDREDAKRREAEAAEDARGKLSAGQVAAGQWIDACGIHRDGLGRIMPAAPEAIAATKAAEAKRAATDEARERERRLGALTPAQRSEGYFWDLSGLLRDKAGKIVSENGNLVRRKDAQPAGDAQPAPEVAEQPRLPETPLQVEARMQRENANAAASRGERAQKLSHDYDPYP